MTAYKTLASLCTAVLAACSNDTPVSDAIRALAVEGEFIRISEHTEFEWDTFHVFSPYTTREDLCSKIGHMMNDCTTKMPEFIDEGKYLLGFSKAGIIVHTEFYRRGKAEFCKMSCSIEFTHEDAIFRYMRIEPQAGLLPPLDLVSVQERTAK